MENKEEQRTIENTRVAEVVAPQSETTKMIETGQEVAAKEGNAAAEVAEVVGVVKPVVVVPEVAVLPVRRVNRELASIGVKMD